MDTPLFHRVTLDDSEREGQRIDAGAALVRVAAIIGAQVVVKHVRDEPRYHLTKSSGPLELSLLAGHLYDTRETLSLVLELRYQDQLIASCGCPNGLERIKLGEDMVWLRTPGGMTIVLGAGPAGLMEIQA